MHLFLVRLKILLRNKTLLFWTFLFPLALSLFFKVAFNNLNEQGFLNTIPIAIIEEGSSNLTTVMDEIYFNEQTKMFDIYTSPKDAALLMLANDEVEGVIEVSGQNIIVSFKKAELNETIIKSFLDQYLQTTSLINNIVVLSSGTISANDLLVQLSGQQEYVANLSFGAQKPDASLNYFYALIGMAIVYGGFWGTQEILYLQPSITTQGLRVSIGPKRRLRLLLTNLSAAFVIHFSQIILFLLFLVYGLGITLGNKPLLVVLLCAIGSFTGITYGAFTTLILKKASEGTKVAVTTLTGIIGGFLSGMMFSNMKFIVMTKLPFLLYLNPVSPITDGLFSLYYFPTLDRYWHNLGILSLMLLVLIIGLGLAFRRDEYESI